MAKVTFNANELRDTDVSLISMVRKGANRIPFRITKEESEMLDISSYASAFKKSDQTPGVCAVVVQKNENYDANVKILTDAGFSATVTSEKDGIVLFKQEGVGEFETGIMKINDDIGLVVSGLKKSFSSWLSEPGSFSELVKTSGFYPSVRMATETFNEMVYSVMAEADSPSDASSRLQKAADDLKTYLSTLATALPVRAFKADNSAADLRKSAGKTKELSAEEKKLEDAKKKGVKKEDETKEATDKPAEEEKKEPVKEPNEEKKPEEGKDDVKKTDEVAPAAEPSTANFADVINAALTKALGGLQTNIAEQFATMKSDLSSTNDRIEDMSKRVKKTEEVVNGTLHNEPEDEQPVRTRKGERTSAGGPIPLMDTAFGSAH